MSSEEHDKFIQEIKRFVNEEKENHSPPSESELSFTSELQSTSGSESESSSSLPLPPSLNERPLPLTRQSTLSDSDEDFFKLKEKTTFIPNIVSSTQEQIDLSSSSEPDILEETNKQELQVVIRGSNLAKVGPVGHKRRLFKRKRRTDTRGEKRRVDESVRRAKEKFQNRTTSAQGEWRQSKTFGLGVDNVKNRSASIETSFQPEREKLEVQDVIRHAVGEPCLSSKLSTNNDVSDLLGNRPLGSAINSTQSLRNFRKPGNVQDDKNEVGRLSEVLPLEISVDDSNDSSPELVYQYQSRPTVSIGICTPVPIPSILNEKEDNDQDLFCLEKYPTQVHEGCGPSQPVSSISSLDSPRSSSSSGFRDLSRIPKSPWFRGKTPSETSETDVTLSQFKQLSVPCVRIEHYVQFTDTDTPIIRLNGSVYTIQPEQWLEILEVASVKSSLIV